MAALLVTVCQPGLVALLADMLQTALTVAWAAQPIRVVLAAAAAAVSVILTPSLTVLLVVRGPALAAAAERLAHPGVPAVMAYRLVLAAAAVQARCPAPVVPAALAVLRAAAAAAQHPRTGIIQVPAALAATALSVFTLGKGYEYALRNC